MACWLVRFGAVPEVGWAAGPSDGLGARGDRVVLRTPRGLQLGELLDAQSRQRAEEPVDLTVERPATAADIAAAEDLARQAEAGFDDWTERIRDWGLAAELLELEWTLDRSTQILYVLTDRGPDVTKLALQAAAAGLGVIEVRPVSADGAGPAPAGGGCGSGGCGCRH